MTTDEIYITVGVALGMILCVAILWHIYRKAKL